MSLSLIFNYCDPLVVSHYLEFSSSSNFYAAAFILEAVTSSSFYQLILGESLLKALLEILRLLAPSHG